MENGHGHGRKENASRLTTAAIILETRKKVSCDIALFPRGHFFFSRDAVVSTKLFFFLFEGVRKRMKRDEEEEDKLPLGRLPVLGRLLPHFSFFFSLFIST